MMIDKLLKVSAIFIFACGLFAADLYAQTCAMSVEITANETETAVKGTTATAVSRKTSRLYRSTFKQGLPYFANLPEGEYVVTVKKVGFKQTIDLVEHACEEAENGVVTAYFSMWKGASSQKVDLMKVPMRTERFTIIGDVNPTVTGTAVNSSNRDEMPPKPIDRPVPKTISGGVLNAKTTSLPKPEYPAAAKAVRASGSVSVQVLIDNDGSVISASAVSGHPLLRAAAESAAREARFSSTLLSGQPVKVSGVIVYNFVP